MRYTMHNGCYCPPDEQDGDPRCLEGDHPFNDYGICPLCLEEDPEFDPES